MRDSKTEDPMEWREEKEIFFLREIFGFGYGGGGSLFKNLPLFFPNPGKKIAIWTPTHTHDSKIHTSEKVILTQCEIRKNTYNSLSPGNKVYCILHSRFIPKTPVFHTTILKY